MKSKNLLPLLALSLISSTGAWATVTCTGTASVQGYMPIEDQISEGVTPDTTQTQVQASHQPSGRRSSGQIMIQTPIQGLDSPNIQITYSRGDAAVKQAFFRSIPGSPSENAHYLGEGTVKQLDDQRIRVRGIIMRQGLEDHVRPDAEDFGAYQSLSIELSCS